MNILSQSREEWNSFAWADEVVVRACCCFNVSFVVFEVEPVDEKGLFPPPEFLSALFLYSHLLLISAGAASDRQPCCDAVTWGWHQRCTVKTWTPSCRTCDVSAEWLMLQCVSVDLFPTSCLRGKHPLNFPLNVAFMVSVCSKVRSNKSW